MVDAEKLGYFALAVSVAINGVPVNLSLFSISLKSSVPANSSKDGLRSVFDISGSREARRPLP